MFVRQETLHFTSVDLAVSLTVASPELKTGLPEIQSITRNSYMHNSY